MKKIAAAIVFVALGCAPAAMAADAQIAEGKMLYDTSGKRLGAIYRVKEDGSVQLILQGKMVTVPADTISVKDGKVETSLDRKQLHAKK